ncbi:hypothetical protein ANCCAN_00617 [Ancylostoma caninum]|uniref:Uncharacterized protein n=1 Tax=Ancylostoma caninum TaxID=29170 RepID=A0A368HBJ3_ANCCA|nr:hypothetical protein ANCCAN_00617 [Ancylostoma caninum]
MQASRSFPCLKGFSDVSPYQKPLATPVISPDLALLDHNYHGWSGFSLQNGCKLIRRNSLPSQEIPFIRNSHQPANQANSVVYLDQAGRPMFHRPIRRRFIPYERPTDKKLPELPIEEVERLLSEIECGDHTGAKKFKRPERRVNVFRRTTAPLAVRASVCGQEIAQPIRDDVTKPSGG